MACTAAIRCRLLRIGSPVEQDIMGECWEDRSSLATVATFEGQVRVLK
jgi:hypothetical protein